MRQKAPTQARKKNTSVAAALSLGKTKSSFSFVDNRPEAITQRKLAEAINQSPRMVAQRAYIDSLFGKSVQRQGLEEEETLSSELAPIQRVHSAENHTGLPTNLKTGIERLSGLSVDEVEVHYNSSKPAQLQALAYTQGADIYVGPGQERHLPHEAWHVVQQKQGRVKPTLQAKGVAINDDQGLEKEADVLGNKSLRAYSGQKIEHEPIVQAMSDGSWTSKRDTIQRVEVSEEKKNEIKDWLGNEKYDESYASPSDEKSRKQAFVHRIDKGTDLDLACWNWALTGFEKNTTVQPADFWTYVLNPDSKKGQENWLETFPESEEKLQEITIALDNIGLARNPFDHTRKKAAKKAEQEAAEPIIKEMCEIMIRANGMEVVNNEKEAEATIVCQYIKTEGAAVPEHWWIEMPGGVVIQTVPGQPLEVGDESTKWHTANGRLSSSAKEYNELRMPIKKLKEAHLKVLIDGMEKQRERMEKQHEQKSKKRSHSPTTEASSSTRSRHNRETYD